MKTLTRIALLCAVLTAFLCVSAYASGVQVTGKPTVNGAPIGTYNLDGVEEIAVPVQVSADAPANVNLFASFYDRNNKYVGMGATTASVDTETSFVIMPVEDAVTGAEVLKMAVTDADFRPLSVSRYSLTSGGGGGGGGSNVTYSYYLRAAASFASENGGSGAAYVMKTQPTEDTDLSEASPLSATFQYQSYSPACVYYVIFAPDNGSELAYPRIVQGPASGVARVPVTLKSAPNAIVYRVSTSGALSEANAPTVTMKGIFRGNGGGSGGGGSSSGGGGSSSGGGGYTPVNPSGPDTPVATKATYYLLARADVVPAEHGTVFMTDVQPSANTTAPYNLSTNRRALFLHEYASNEAHNLTGYVVFVPDDGYELDPATVSVTKPVTVHGQATTANVTHSDPALVTIANGQRAYWISFTETGNTNSSTDVSRAPDVTITAGFKAIQPPTPVEEVTWTVAPNVIGGLVEISETAFADDKTQVTTNLTGIRFVLEKGQSKTIYVAVSPDTANGFRPGNPNLTRTDNGAVMANPTPQVSFDGTLYVYPLTVTNIQSNTTTVLEGAFEADALSLYDVNVQVKYYNGTAIVTPPDSVVLLNPYTEENTVRANTGVAVFAPVTKGYQVREVIVTGASGKTCPVALARDDADLLEYVFTMPNESVTVQVVFEEKPDPVLTYTIKVNFEGSGMLNLYVGEHYVSFDDRNRTEYSVTMTSSEYSALYGNTDFADRRALPVFLDSAPISEATYTYDAASSLTDALKNSSRESPDVSLTPGQTMELNVVFLRNHLFGYELTIIGKGAVAVNFNGASKSYSNDLADVMSASHSDYLAGVESVDLSFTPMAAEGWVFDSALMNNEPGTADTLYAAPEGMTDIVVTFQKEDAKPVAFTVKVDGANGNAVTLKAENGRFAEGALPADPSVAKNNVNSGVTTATVTGSATYYAYEGTIITLVPQPADGYQVNQILVNGDANVPDALPTAGFTYTLPRNSDTEFLVTFEQLAQSGGLDHQNETPVLSGAVEYAE